MAQILLCTDCTVVRWPTSPFLIAAFPCIVFASCVGTGSSLGASSAADDQSESWRSLYEWLQTRRATALADQARRSEIEGDCTQVDLDGSRVSRFAFAGYGEFVVMSGFEPEVVLPNHLDGKRILDSATGLGFVALELMLLGVDARGFDQYVDADLANVHLPGELQPRFTVADAREPDALRALCPEGSDGCFDVILDNYGLAQFADSKDLPTVFGAFRELLAPQGELWITGINTAELGPVVTRAIDAHFEVISWGLRADALDNAPRTKALKTWFRNALSTAPSRDVRDLWRQSLRATHAGAVPHAETLTDDALVTKAFQVPARDKSRLRLWQEVFIRLRRGA